MNDQSVCPPGGEMAQSGAAPSPALSVTNAAGADSSPPGIRRNFRARMSDGRVVTVCYRTGDSMEDDLKTAQPDADGVYSLQELRVLWRARETPRQRAFREALANGGKASSKGSLAEQWLRDFLADGPRRSSDVYKHGADFAQTTLKRAKGSLGVVTNGRGVAATWELPA